MKISAGSLQHQQGSFQLSVTQVFGDGIHLVTGRIGSGKSTLSLLLSGQLTPESGSVTRAGITSYIITLQFPEYHITGATVTDEIKSWGIDPSVVDPVLIPDSFRDRDPLTLSRGELKRLTLACAFAKEPDLLIMDEPFSSLDTEMKDWLCNQIRVRRHGITIIFTHERETLPDADYYYEMRDGSLHSAGYDPEERDGRELFGSSHVQCQGQLGDPVAEEHAPSEEEKPVFLDPRLRLFSILCLSLGAFLSIGGAVIALAWWVIAAWGRWKLPNRTVALLLLILVLAPALGTELLGGDGLSYGIRIGTILFLSFWAFTEYRGGELLNLFVWAGTDRLGFDIGLAAEMTMQGIHLAVSDIRQIIFAYDIKGYQFTWKTIIPASISLLTLHIRRSEEMAHLLAIRGFRGGGTWIPVFSRGQKEPYLTLIALIPLIFALITLW